MAGRRKTTPAAWPFVTRAAGLRWEMPGYEEPAAQLPDAIGFRLPPPDDLDDQED